MSEIFKSGDQVSWSSSAAGSETTKYGQIVAVIPANKPVENFLKKFPTDKYSHQLGSGSVRDHESYLVVVQERENLKPRLYRPMVSKLQADTRGEDNFGSNEPPRIGAANVQLPKVTKGTDCTAVGDAASPCSIENIPKVVDQEAKTIRKKTDEAIEDMQKKKRSRTTARIESINQFSNFARKREFMKTVRTYRKQIRRQITVSLSKEAKELFTICGKACEKYSKYKDAGKYRIFMESLWKTRHDREETAKLVGNLDG